jgi:hypothetical protein
MHAPTSPDRAHPNGHSCSPAATPGPESGRDAQGRFAEGNRGGPGNPFARQVAALRCGLVARLTPQDLADVADALLRQAKEGSVAAAKLLLSYALGKPAQTVDPDTLDLHEWDLIRRTPDPAPEMAAAPHRIALPVALKYLRATLPPIADAQCGMIRDGLRAMDDRDRKQAQARDRRAARRQQKKTQPADARPAPPEAAPRPEALPPDVARALELLADDPELLALFLPPGAAGAPATPRQDVPPPSPNGGSRRGRPGG